MVRGRGGELTDRYMGHWHPGRTDWREWRWRKRGMRRKGVRGCSDRSMRFSSSICHWMLWIERFLDWTGSLPYTHTYTDRHVHTHRHMYTMCTFRHHCIDTYIIYTDTHI